MKRSVRKDAFQRIEDLCEGNSFEEDSEHKEEILKGAKSKDERNELKPEFDECSKCHEKIKELNAQISTLQTMLENSKRKAKILKRHLRYKEKRLMQDRNAKQILQKQVFEINIKNRNALLFEQNMKNFFTKTQITSIITNGKINRWSEEDVSRAIVIRALSRKAFDFWKNKIGIPLPSSSTLKRWCSKFKCEPGILNNVLLIMKKCGENLDNFDKICILSFDEMHIDSRLCYNQSLDQILGPYTKVLVVMARGLTSPWKQPIYFDFQKIMNKKLMTNIILNLDAIGIEVKGVVSDLGGCMSLWKECQITQEKSYFIHPSKNSKIWVFADLPHYLKLLRNHFLDHGLVLGDGTIISKDIINEVIKEDSGEIKMCYKLLPSYLTVKGNERQKVKPAKTLFSLTTAKAIRCLTKHREAANFFELVDSFFDVMNSSYPQPDRSKPLTAGFGISPYYQNQREVLNNMKNAISDLRVKGKSSLLPFQKGILVSISSLIGLYEDMRIVGIKYILTSCLTQDSLESLFSQIRGIGRFYDHPSSTEFICRLKQILLANKLPCLSEKSNTTELESHSVSTYLTAELLKDAFEPNEPIDLPDNEDEEFAALQTICKEPWFSDEEDTTEIKINKNVFSEQEALKFIAGYVAFRVKDKDPSLGYTAKENDFEKFPWICSLSAGRLTAPSESWMEIVENLETVFHTLHGDLVSKKKGIIDDFKQKILTKFPELNEEAARIYARIRTFIRIRHLNRNRKLVASRKSYQKNLKWKKSSL